MFDRYNAQNAVNNLQFQQIAPAQETTPNIYSDFTFSNWGNLPPDSDVPGFAPGMDDLGQIVLNNKYRVKYNKNTLTEAGARDWVAKKNKTIKDPKKFWEMAYQDINNDGINDVIIRDGNKKIKYINGWHLGKADKLDLAHQKDIEEKYGLPYDRLIAKATGKIPEKALSRNYFLWKNTIYDPEHPDAALKPNELLQAYGYKPRAPSASNLLLSYVTKDLYNNAVIEYTDGDEIKQKMIKKILGVIKANAAVYKIYVKDYVDTYFETTLRIPPKEAKKRHSGEAMSRYSQECLLRVKEIAETPDLKQEIYNYIYGTLIPTVTNTYQYEPVNAIYFKDSVDPNVFSGNVRRKIKPERTIPQVEDLMNKADYEEAKKIKQARLNTINAAYRPMQFRKEVKPFQTILPPIRSRIANLKDLQEKWLKADKLLANYLDRAGIKKNDKGLPVSPEGEVLDTGEKLFLALMKVHDPEFYNMLTEQAPGQKKEE